MDEVSTKKYWGKNKEQAQNHYLYHQKSGKEKQYYEDNKETLQKMPQDQ